jgi:hypothetical protein
LNCPVSPRKPLASAGGLSGYKQPRGLNPVGFSWQHGRHRPSASAKRGGDTVRDIVIGMSDGLTVPFALAAGISGAISAAHIVVTAGFAEIAAGSIAMGLGGYLAARSEAEHYQSELAREETEIVEKPDVEAEEVAEFFRQYGLTGQEYGPVVEGLRTKPKAWRDFMVRFELGLEEPDPTGRPTDFVGHVDLHRWSASQTSGADSSTRPQSRTMPRTASAIHFSLRTIAVTASATPMIPRGNAAKQAKIAGAKLEKSPLPRIAGTDTRKNVSKMPNSGSARLNPAHTGVVRFDSGSFCIRRACL